MVNDYIEQLAARQRDLGKLRDATARLSSRMVPSEKRAWNRICLRQLARQAQLADHLRGTDGKPPTPRMMEYFRDLHGAEVAADALARELLLLPDLPTKPNADAQNGVEPDPLPALRELFVNETSPSAEILVAPIASAFAKVFNGDRSAIDQYRFALKDAAARKPNAKSKALSGVETAIPWIIVAAVTAILGVDLWRTYQDKKRKGPPR